ncbi:site-specific DNA-methyltransferase [Mesorhizobium sp. M0051]|uniref:DNA methyltransferase n=1 Tax=Mesorhizobium sp. M0051 TaxID=2956862 RepID=UPI00333C740F
MFPLEYPLQIIKKHKKYNPVVVDPFCGRGTTIYAARKGGLRSYGFDTSPIAVAIAKAKLASASSGDILMLATELLETEPRNIPDSPFFQKAYSNSTLRQLCSLREGLLRLDKETDESALLRAAALGCLHGPRASDLARSGYFSNQMPRTFASKPDYSVRFWKKKELVAPKVSVLDVIRRKIERIPDLNSPTVGSFERIRCVDARFSAPYRNIKGSILAVTSPPYYGMRTYVQDQWLRNWFLGGPDDVDYNTDIQIRHSSHDDFVRDLARVWTHLKKSATDGIDLYVRFGTIPSIKSDARQLLRASLEESGGWKLLYTRRARTASEGKRQAEQMKSDSSAAEEFDFHAVAV